MTFSECKIGDKGTSVIVLQAFLRSMHFVGKDGKRITVDGVFGANTGRAVYNFKLFCKNCGNKVALNEVCDKATWNMIMGG